MTRARTKTPEPIAQRRCAIYTRKSTEEGLDQDFNSLDAQYESAKSYIESQRGEGWTLLEDRYDDGGFSGGSMNRPALKRLLADVEAGRIDCIVVYKVDRLSRSLIDFSKIVDLLDRHRANFVSVTEHFTTATSMGRLTLNMILSFAQFEREIAAERIRDKVAAAKRKGKHTGGVPILGYDVIDRRLVVNETEAELVRHIFERFTKLGSATQLARELNETGHTTKCWKTKKDRVEGGRRWKKGHIYRLLNNRKVIGEVEHKGEVYPGEHEAIVSKKLWDDVHRILAENYATRSNRTRAKTPALLKGIIRCKSCDRSMGPTFTTRRGKQYRYYLCTRAGKEGYDACPLRSIPAGDIEEAVLSQLRAVLCQPELVARTYREAKALEERERERLGRQRTELDARVRELEARLERFADAADGGGATIAQRMRELGREIDDARSELERATRELRVLETEAVTEGDVMAALERLDPVWDELFPGEQARIVRLLVERVDVSPDGGQVRIRGNGLGSLVQELAAEEPESQAHAPECTATAEAG